MLDVGERGYFEGAIPLSYGEYGNAKRWRMEKMAISMQRSSDGIPTLRSGYWIFAVGSTTFKVEDVRILIKKDCQKERKMTNLMATTFKRGRWGARSTLS
jgi:hypothetical protein